MSNAVLLRKLIAIEQCIGVAANSEVRDRIQEAQEYLLEMQRQMAENVRSEVNWDPVQRFNFARQFVPNRRTGTTG